MRNRVILGSGCLLVALAVTEYLVPSSELEPLPESVAQAISGKGCGGYIPLKDCLSYRSPGAWHSLCDYCGQPNTCQY